MYWRILPSVFEYFQIDFCCGGNLLLEEACARKGLDFEQVAAKLNALDKNQKQGSEPDWTKVDLQSLVKHILDDYHEPLKEELAELRKLASKVARVHGANYPEMIEVDKLVSIFSCELEGHMQKEEMVLFPAILSLERGEAAPRFGCGHNLQMPIMVMLQEHDQAGAMLERLRRLTNEYTAPEGACNSFRVLLSLLHKIESDLHMHVLKENNILFPRTLALLKK